MQILSVGYNGFARGVDETKSERWDRPTKYDFCVHSEINSICNAARSGTSLEGSIAIVTLYPCCDCCRALIQSGIKTLVSLPPNYDDPKWGEQFRVSSVMMQEAGVEIMLLNSAEVAYALCAPRITPPRENHWLNFRGRRPKEKRLLKTNRTMVQSRVFFHDVVIGVIR